MYKKGGGMKMAKKSLTVFYMEEIIIRINGQKIFGKRICGYLKRRVLIQRRLMFFHGQKFNLLKMNTTLRS